MFPEIRYFRVREDAASLKRDGMGSGLDRLEDFRVREDAASLKRRGGTQLGLIDLETSASVRARPH